MLDGFNIWCRDSVGNSDLWDVVKHLGGTRNTRFVDDVLFDLADGESCISISIALHELECWLIDCPEEASRVRSVFGSNPMSAINVYGNGGDDVSKLVAIFLKTLWRKIPDIIVDRNGELYVGDNIRPLTVVYD